VATDFSQRIDDKATIRGACGCGFWQFELHAPHFEESPYDFEQIVG
jgi:hypothetical protein